MLQQRHRPITTLNNYLIQASPKQLHNVVRQCHSCPLSTYTAANLSNLYVNPSFRLERVIGV